MDTMTSYLLCHRYTVYQDHCWNKQNYKGYLQGYHDLVSIYSIQKDKDKLLNYYIALCNADLFPNIHPNE